MTRFHADVELPVGVEAAYAYLADPRNRPRWQRSLRSVTADEPVAAPGPGQSWSERTVLGIRPRLRVSRFEPYRAWAEHGVWRGVEADLELRFTRLGPRRCRVRADADVRGSGGWAVLAWVAARLGGVAIAADLRAAGERISR